MLLLLQSPVHNMLSGQQCSLPNKNIELSSRVSRKRSRTCSSKEWSWRIDIIIIPFSDETKVTSTVKKFTYS